MKQAYSVYEAKAHLSEIIREVQRNRRVIITYRGREVAEIIPRKADEESLKSRITRLEQEGIIKSGHQIAEKLANIKPIITRAGALQRFLDERHEQ